jgi:hypothetical protein
MKKIVLIALGLPLALSACGGTPYRVETRDPVVQNPSVITQERLDEIQRERNRDASRSGR